MIEPADLTPADLEPADSGAREATAPLVADELRSFLHEALGIPPHTRLLSVAFERGGVVVTTMYAPE